jgi:hypothetical protein
MDFAIGIAAIVFVALAWCIVRAFKDPVAKKSEDEHQRDVSDLPKPEPKPADHTQHFTAEEAHRRELGGLPKRETSSQVLVPGITGPVEIKGISVETSSPQETTPAPIKTPNKPIRKNKRKH